MQLKQRHKNTACSQGKTIFQSGHKLKMMCEKTTTQITYKKMEVDFTRHVVPKKTQNIVTGNQTALDI